MTDADLALALDATDQAFAAVGERQASSKNPRRAEDVALQPVTRAGTVETAGDAEEEILGRAGYKPELRRSLRFFSMFAIAFSIISITTGIFLNYGFGLQYWGPARSGPGRSSASAT